MSLEQLFASYNSGVMRSRQAYAEHLSELETGGPSMT